jgi:hypothetical protein
MKTTKRIFLLGAFALTIITKAQTTSNQCTNMQENIPKNLFELAVKTRLTIDLTDNCNFQPVHYQVRSEQPTTEIIARFTGEKVGEDFAIKKVELKHFEVTENPRTVIIDNAHFTTKDNMKVIVVELRNLDEPNEDNMTRKKRFEQEHIDFILVSESPEIINKNTIVDIHIKNEKELYPEPEVLKSNGEEALGRPFGRHCQNNVHY